jgi:sterol desaturase/sphingolipid hydroxylase (fatty acid hydroxylase superfamily)
MNPDVLRLLAVIGLLAALLILERHYAYRRDADLRAMFDNLALAFLGSGVLRLMVPLGAVGVALWAEAHDVGLFPRIGLDGVFAIAATIVLMDAAIWAQHVAFHRLPWLWRLHRVHHVATRFETTLGLRFHPLEILISFAWKALLVISFGLPAVGVALYETLLVLAALWTHADLALPPRLERAVSAVLVTPTWHRVHHSPDRACTNSHYANLLTLWDRLCRTRPALAPADQRVMAIGLETWRDDADQRWPALLLNPFRRAPNPERSETPDHA